MRKNQVKCHVTAAEHGARWRLPGSPEWQGRWPAKEWKDKMRPILDHFVEQTPGSFVEEKECALVWHYRTAEIEFGEWLATELVSMLEGMLAETELHVYRGKKIVEVKPIWANKGALANELLPEYADAGFLLGIGDDRTDEDLFARLPATAWTVHVGADSSKARFRVADSSRVAPYSCASRQRGGIDTQCQVRGTSCHPSNQP